MDISKFKVSKEDKENGRWFHFEDGIQFKIKPIRHKDTMKAIQKVSQTMGIDLLDNRNVFTEEAREQRTKIFAEHVVVDWKNIEVNGKTLPYSPEKAFEILMDEQFEILSDFIMGTASDMDKFRAKQVEENVKKSEITIPLLKENQ